MGPVGILCVQRTLNKGRHTGLFTGVGAALSDLIYCLLTGFGLSFIEEFLERNSNIIQLLGSLVLIGFGVYLFKSNPSRQLKKPLEQHVSAGKNILNGFLFTFSNPLIIFLIIGLFARFNFLLPEIRFYHYIIGYIAIFAGAMGWWYFVTYFVDKVRAHFNLRSMWLVNKIIGSVIFLFAIVGIITAISGIASAAPPARYYNSIRGFKPFQNATDSTLIISNTNTERIEDMIPISSCQELKWEFRIADLKHSTNGWGIKMKNENGEELIVTFAYIDNRFDETYTSPHLELDIKRSESEKISKQLYRGVNLENGENAFRIVTNRDNWSLFGGNREYSLLYNETGNGFIPDSIGFVCFQGGAIEIGAMLVDVKENLNQPALLNSFDLATLRNGFTTTTDPLEGEWAIYDHQVEDDYLRLGGDYHLAIKKSGLGYDIIYLGGACKNTDSWQPGMLKGRLIPGHFKNVYDVEWLDISGETITPIKAEHDDSFLRLIFPELSSEIRLAKVELPTS